MKEILKNIIVGAPGSYNMFHLEIEIGGKTMYERNPTIFHEYTHYIQNMTTISGFVRLDKYIHVFLRSCSKLGSDSDDPKIPLRDYDSLMHELGDKNIENIIRSYSFGMDFDYCLGNYVFADTDLDDYTISEQEYIDHYSGLVLKIPFVAIDGKNIPINEIVIKENMALVNSIIGYKQNDSLTVENINEILSYAYKEYNVLFDFINHYLPNCNILKLVYSICEISLNIYFSERVIGNILHLIQDNYEEMSKFETDKIICLIRKSINYESVFLSLYNIIQGKVIKKTLDLFDIFINSKNQFVDILKRFYTFLIQGMKYRLTQKTFYIDNLTNEYIQILTSAIGCPIIYFKNENEYKNLLETPKYFFDDFVYLHASLKVFMILYCSNVTVCPFINLSICTLEKNNNCSLNCLDNFYNNNYKNCLLSNALGCTGIRQDCRNV